MKDKQLWLHKWMWWEKGECVVEVLTAGHYPTTVIVKLPNDAETEIDIDELDMAKE
jgi:hypothetical protein